MKTVLGASGLGTLVLFVACLFASPERPSSPSPLPAPPAAVLPTSPLPAGYYLAQGSHEESGPYELVVVIRVREDRTYLLHWLGIDLIGVGRRVGDSFVVSFGGRPGHGLAIYRPGKQANEWVGQWLAVPGPGKWQPETLTLLREIRQADDGSDRQTQESKP